MVERCVIEHSSIVGPLFNCLRTVRPIDPLERAREQIQLRVTSPPLFGAGPADDQKGEWHYTSTADLIHRPVIPTSGSLNLQSKPGRAMAGIIT